jgi:hypothetical protein
MVGRQTVVAGSALPSRTHLRRCGGDGVARLGAALRAPCSAAPSSCQQEGRGGGEQVGSRREPARQQHAAAWTAGRRPMAERRPQEDPRSCPA